jgi:stage II sporulation protein M
MQKEKEYFYSSRKYFLAAVAVFSVSFAVGVLISVIYPGASEKLLEMLKDTYGGITALDPFERMIEIFKNNVSTCFMALLGGLAVGILPLFIVAINGAVLGILVDLFFKKQGAFFVIAAIMPHGIIELPMVLISVGIGFRLGHTAYLSMIHQKTMHELINEITNGVLFYIRIVVPLLLLAALVESYVTPLLIYMFFK